MAPETSVIIPVHNGERFIGAAVASVLAQLAPYDEVIVVDDGSTDASRAVADSVGDARVRVLGTGGRGVSVARNAGLRIARGRYVAFLDHDDAWPAGRHAGLRGVLVADESIDAAFGLIRLLYEPGARANWTADFEGRHNCPQITTALFRRSLLEKIDGFNVNLRAGEGEDTDYYIRLREAGMKELLCDVDGLIYRRHAANVTNDFARAQRGLLNSLRLKIARRRASASPGDD